MTAEKVDAACDPKLMGRWVQTSESETKMVSMRIYLSWGLMLACLIIPSSGNAAPTCPGNTTYAPGTGCVKNSIVERAKHNCKYGPAKTDQWVQCICNDGGKVDACGD
jgi:hypothetical protein